MDKYRLQYLNICVRSFAEKFKMSNKVAFSYLRFYGGMDFLSECYEIEHTLPIEDTMDSLQKICRKSGGSL